MLNSNHYQWNNNKNGLNPSQAENRNWDVEKFVPQGDAIYDYERIPAWNCFDEQPTVYQYGDTSVGQNHSNNNDGSDVSKLAS